MSANNSLAKGERRLQIVVNGEPMKIAEELTLFQLLSLLKINAITAVIEYNDQIIPRNQWSMALSDGDKVEILQFMGGG